MIKIEHLAKRFGDLEVLKDVSLEIGKGEVVAIIGPSGSGKSTLLRCINLLETPDSGSIVIDGTNILEKAWTSLKSAQNVGMIFLALQPFRQHDSAAEHGLRPHGRAWNGKG